MELLGNLKIYNRPKSNRNILVPQSECNQRQQGTLSQGIALLTRHYSLSLETKNSFIMRIYFDQSIKRGWPPKPQAILSLTIKTS